MLKRLTMDVPFPIQSLPAGSTIECEALVGLCLGDGKVLILDSNMYEFEENEIVELVSRSENDWIVNYGSGYRGLWVKRDWNGHVGTREFDVWEDFDDGDFDWDDGLEHLDRYQDYDY